MPRKSVPNTAPTLFKSRGGAVLCGSGVEQKPRGVAVCPPDRHGLAISL